MHFADPLQSVPPLREVVGRAMGLDDRRERGRTLLAGLLAEPGLLSGLPLARTAGSYARTFLFGDDAVCAWAFTWDAGARTPIHDHHCSCCFGILSGTLNERRFGRLADGRVTLSGEVQRPAGFVACLLPTGPNIHQMVNATAREAVSVHLYGFDRTRHASSVEREYRLART